VAEPETKRLAIGLDDRRPAAAGPRHPIVPSMLDGGYPTASAFLTVRFSCVYEATVN
jgi:hypothetical protein